MFPIACRRQHAPILPQARVAWEFDEADTSWFCFLWDSLRASTFGTRHTWAGRHRQGQIAVAGPYYLDGSAFNPEIVELRRSGWGFAVLEPPEPVTMTVVPVAPPCLD